jgi:hypothetical protein
MMTDQTRRFLQRLPQFVQFFFPLTLITGFREFGDRFDWMTQPSFNMAEPADVLIAASFLVTIFWVVTDWIGYNWLIERVPYTLGLSRFYFDVARFSLMFAIVNFSFLAGEGTSYHYYIFALALWHVAMLGWHVTRIVGSPSEGRSDRLADARGHGMRFLTFFVLGIVYFFGVSFRAEGVALEPLHYALVGLTLLAIIGWNAIRLTELKGREPAGEPQAVPSMGD